LRFRQHERTFDFTEDNSGSSGRARPTTACGSSGGAACWAGGVMACDGAQGRGREGAEGVDVAFAPAADRDAARSRGDPEAPCASGDGPLRGEPRPRPARTRRCRILSGSSRARRAPSCLRREASSALIRPVRGRLTAALCPPSILLSRAGSLDPRGGRSYALWQRLLGRPASESGRLCQGAGGHAGGGRCRRGRMLPTLKSCLGSFGPWRAASKVRFVPVIRWPEPPEKGCWTAETARAHSAKVNPTQKQFSLNRAASKKQFPISLAARLPAEHVSETAALFGTRRIAHRSGMLRRPRVARLRRGRGGSPR